MAHTQRKSRKELSKQVDHGIPWWLIIAAIAALPTHILVWMWFSASGIDLIHEAALTLTSAIVPFPPTWLTSIFYFPMGLLVFAITESAAMAPINLLLLVFGIRQYRALRGSKHFSTYKPEKTVRSTGRPAAG